MGYCLHMSLFPFPIQMPWGRRRRWSDSDDDDEKEKEYGPEAHTDTTTGVCGQKSMARGIFQALKGLDDMPNIGDFAYSVVDDAPNPGIHCGDQFGYLGLPPNETNIKELIKYMKHAPYGNLATRETVIDHDVRKTLELDAKDFSINGPAWANFMKKQLQQLKDKFVLPETTTVHANLYKLLLYEPGGFFMKHKDTEKESGMFATMAVVLPCLFKGGDVVVTHNDKEEIFKASENSGSVDKVTVITWFSDIDHEVKPVTEGYRLCLIYNIIAKSSCTPSGSKKCFKKDDGPRPPVDLASSGAGAVLAKRLRYYASNQPQWHFIYILDHLYSEVGLDDFGLKRLDKLIEVALKNAIDKAQCGIVMELVKIRVIGSFSDVGKEDFEDYCESHKCIAKSKLKGDIEFDCDAVLQPITTQKMGTLRGGQNMGNYTGNYEQDYHGRGLLLFVEGKMCKRVGKVITAALAEDELTQIFEANLGLPPYFEISDSIDSYLKTHLQIWNQDMSDPLMKFNDKLIACDDYKEKRLAVQAMNVPTDMWGNLKLVAMKSEDALYDMLMEIEDAKTAAALNPTLNYVYSEYKKVVQEIAACDTNYSQCANKVSTKELKDFFNSDERTLHLTVDKPGRLAIHQQLNGIDVDHETINRGRPRAGWGTLVIRKRETMKKIALQKKQVAEVYLTKLSEKINLGETYVHNIYVGSSCIKNEMETTDSEINDE